MLLPILKELRQMARVNDHLRSQIRLLASSAEVLGRGDQDSGWPDKREAEDPEWDNDYGWGGGRFGKRGVDQISRRV